MRLSTFAFAAAATLLAVGCGGDDGTDSGFGTGDTTTETTPDPLTVTATWSGASPAAALAVAVTDPAGRTAWEFGMAETENMESGWFGEDCLNGTGSFMLCHSFSGAALNLAEVGTPQEVVAGSTTLLTNGFNLTYYLGDAAADATECWVWGHDAAYYGSLGCTTL